MSGTEAVGIVVMLNNYFHDLATAIFFCSVVGGLVIINWARTSESRIELALQLGRKFAWIARISLIWILLGGTVRAIAYRDFEWNSAAGSGQIPALIVKHILLVTVIIIGLAIYWKLSKSISVEAKKDENV